MNCEFQYVQLTAWTSQSPAEEDHVLDVELDERVQPVLEVDEQPAVLEGLARVAVGDPARDLVGEQEAEPDRELEPEVSPAARQIPVPDRDDCPGHAGIPAKLVPATAGPILTCLSALAREPVPDVVPTCRAELRPPRRRLRPAAERAAAPAPAPPGLVPPCAGRRRGLRRSLYQSLTAGSPLSSAATRHRRTSLSPSPGKDRRAIEAVLGPHWSASCTRTTLA